MQTIGYARVSTDTQADRGCSLEAQQARVRAMATLHDVQVDEMIVDAGFSAKDLRRPGMERLLALVETGQVSRVIVAKLDRLTRSVKDLASLLETFERRGVCLNSVAESLDTSSAAGRLVLNIMVSVSQWEREAIGERTRETMGHLRSTGRFTGNAPYGCRVSNDGLHVEPEASEQRTLQTIRRWRAGGKSLRRIAADLNRRGLRTRAGSDWRQEYVRRVLKASAGLP